MAVVLVINDDRDLLDAYQDVIRQLGHEPVAKLAARSGADTVRETRAQALVVDLERPDERLRAPGCRAGPGGSRASRASDHRLHGCRRAPSASGPQPAHRAGRARSAQAVHNRGVRGGAGRVADGVQERNRLIGRVCERRARRRQGELRIGLVAHAQLRPAVGPRPGCPVSGSGRGREDPAELSQGGGGRHRPTDPHVTHIRMCTQGEESRAHAGHAVGGSGGTGTESCGSIGGVHTTAGNRRGASQRLMRRPMDPAELGLRRLPSGLPWLWAAFTWDDAAPATLPPSTVGLGTPPGGPRPIRPSSAGRVVRGHVRAPSCGDVRNTTRRTGSR